MLESFREGLKEEVNNLKENELPKLKKKFKTLTSKLKNNFKPWCKKVKKELKELWKSIKLNYLESKKLEYLSDEEKKLHKSMKKELENYIFEDEELLFETTKINKQKLLKYFNPLNIINTMDCICLPQASFFITDKRVITLSPLELKKIENISVKSYYYSEIGDVSLLQESKDKHNIILRPKGTSYSSLNIIIYPCVSKEIYKIISSKVHENLKEA